jgi:hypothetical protein
MNTALSTLRANLLPMVGWNSFAASIIEQIDVKGVVSDKQVAACEKMLAKLASKSADRATKSGDVDMAAIEALFATAKASGLKRLAFIADGLRISPAPETGRNAGAYYVKSDDAYQGKIVGGRFIASGEADATTLPRLAEIAADPAGMARLYGKRTGICCCCGKELTDADSIAAGIGPVCAKRWGL